MPRPTAVRLALGSATVVCSTVALLLVTGATGDAAIALSAALSLLLGLAVTLADGATPTAGRRPAGRAPGPLAEPEGRGRREGVAVRPDSVR